MCLKRNLKIWKYSSSSINSNVKSAFDCSGERFGITEMYTYPVSYPLISFLPTFIFFFEQTNTPLKSGYDEKDFNNGLISFIWHKVMITCAIRRVSIGIGRTSNRFCFCFFSFYIVFLLFALFTIWADGVVSWEGGVQGGCRAAHLSWCPGLRAFFPGRHLFFSNWK